MDFRTQIELPVGLPPITHAGQILMMGSCFVQNVGNFLKDAKFQLDLNPFGILYNPSSLSAVLIEILKRKVYKKGDLFSIMTFGIVLCIMVFFLDLPWKVHCRISIFGCYKFIRLCKNLTG